MSELSNLFDRSPAEAARYVSRLMELLGDRDPLAVQEELLPALAGVPAALPAALLRRPERPGKWSIAQVIAHLADSELVHGYRLRMVVAHPGAAIAGYDQDRWARELRYDEVEIDDALDQLGALRRANLRLQRSLDEAQLEHAGMHSERGRESVRHYMRMIAGHDLVHRRQIERIQQAVTRGETQPSSQ
jgi:hypothetical protein